MAETKWEVQSTTTNKVATTTATYKVDGKVVAVITGLKTGLKGGSSISGIVVTEGTGGGTGTIQLASGVLTAANISLSLKNGGKYQLALVEGGYDKVTAKDVTMSTPQSGTLKLTGNLTAGYNLTKATSITYSAPKTGVELATVSGLDSDLAIGTGTNEGKIGVNKTEGEGAEAVTTFTEAVTIEDGVITLKANALTNKNATLKLSNGANYTLALDSGVAAPGIGSGSWVDTTNRAGAFTGVSTYTADVDTAGYTLSADSKTVTYTATGSDVGLVTLSGLKASNDLSFKQDSGEDVIDAKKNRTIVLPASALNKTAVKITKGTGFLLSLGEDVSQDASATKKTWGVSGTTATYKTVTPEYYTYNASTNQVTYTKQADVKTLATLKGVQKGLTAGDTINGVTVDDTNNIITLSGGANNTGEVTEGEALGAATVTLTNGTGSTYKLALAANDTPISPETSDEEWAVSGTTATLKGKTTAGYSLTNDTTITYVKNSGDKLVNLATVKGLVKGVATESKTEKGAVGINTKVDNVTTFTPGLQVNQTNGRTLIVSKNVLGTTDVTITPTAGYTYGFALDDGEDTTITNSGGAVPLDYTTKHFWYIQGKKLLLKKGDARYYRLTDSTTITEIDEKVGDSVATVTGIKSGRKVVDGSIAGIEVSGQNIILSEEVLDKETTVSVSNIGNNNYALAIAKDDAGLLQHEGTVWEVDGTTAGLWIGDTSGYVLTNNNKTLEPRPASTETMVALLTGLKSGLKVVDNKIDGIKESEEYKTSNPTASKTITLSKNVLGTTDVTLNATGISKGYSLDIDNTVISLVDTGDNKNLTKEWTHDPRKKDTAYYQVTAKKAGFEKIEDNDSVVYQLAYKKAGTVKTTLSGLKDDVTPTNAPDEETGVITLDSSLLGNRNVTLKNATGGTYKLALSGGVSAPEKDDDSFTWIINNKTKATLQGIVDSEGYELSSDGLSVFYTPASGDDPDDATVKVPTTLATVNGLKSGITVEELKSGITIEGNTLTLTKDVLGTSKLTVADGSYKFALGSGVYQEATPQDKKWVTNGTTATFKSYMSEYYTLDAKATTVKYTKPTAGTVYATVKGVAKDANLTSALTLNDDNDPTKGGTVTLTTAMLGTSNVTITGNKYNLALDGEVPKKAKNETEWVTNGTTATYKNYDKAYYTGSGSKITYHKPTAGTTYATVKGIANGATITDNNKVITLSADQLAGKKVTLTGSGYSLKLGDDVTIATPGDIWWEQAKNASNATLKQAVTKGYTLANANTITYSANDTTPTIATVTAPTITKNTSGNVITTKDEATQEEYSGFTANETAKTITVEEAAFGNDPNNNAKVTLKSTEYSFKKDNELGSPAQDPDSLKWTLNKNGTATYTQTISEGYNLSNDAKTITYVTEKLNQTLATISGLNKTALAEAITSGNTIDVTDNDLKENYGISLSGNKITLSSKEYLGTGKITLGKNDPYEFVLDTAVKPTENSGKKWTLSGTTATYSNLTSNGYEAKDTKSVAYVKEALGDTIVTISGIKKGLKISKDGTKIGVIDNTSNPKDVTKDGITVTEDLNSVKLATSVLGTTDITLTNGEGKNFKFANDNIKAPNSAYNQWTYSNGTATYKEIQNSGYTLESDSRPKKITYTAAKTTTLATVKGLNKTFIGDVESALTVSGDTITVSKDILTTSNATITVPRNAATVYSLVIGDAPQQANEATEWVTNGTTAAYKTYMQAYYTSDANTGAIVYHKPTAGTTYATVTGLKKGATISNTDFAGDKNGGTITLAAKHLGTTKVAVSVPKTNSSAVFTLATAGDVPSSSVQTSGWVTSGTNAVYRDKYDKGSYSLANNVITYKKGANEKGTELATIKGVTGDITSGFGTTTATKETFMLTSEGLSNKITLAPTATEGVSAYKFNFNDTYNNANITGSANADTITVAGDRLTITGGKGNDTITLGTEDRAGNVLIYNNGDGEDTIANFQAKDSITIKGVTPEVDFSGSDIEITFGNKAGKITLSDCDLTSITINGKTYEDESASNVLLADNNYSMDAANLSSIVQADISSYTPYDFTSNFSLTKEDKLTPQISYSGNNK